MPIGESYTCPDEASFIRNALNVYAKTAKGQEETIALIRHYVANGEERSRISAAIDDCAARVGAKVLK